MTWDYGGGAAGPPGAPGSAGTPGTPGTSVGSGLISGGGVINTTAYTYIVAAAVYQINGTVYTSPQTTLSLTASDVTNDRIDLLALDSTGAAVVVTGVAAANPAEPTLDPLSQIKVEFIYVAANSASATVATTNIYLENTEWTSTVVGAPINAASTVNPYAGTVDIEATAAINGNYISLANGSAFDTTTRNIFAFFLRSKASWPNQKSLVIQWYSGTVAKGTPVTIKTGAFGFNSGTLGSYQLVPIPMAAFGVAGLSVDRVRFTVTGGGDSIGWYLDNIIMQAGVAQVQPSAAMVWRGPYSSVVQYLLNDVVLSGTIAYVSLQTQLGAAPPGTGWTALSAAAAGALTPTAVKTSAYNAVAGDFIPADTTSAGFTVTLPTAPADMTRIGIKQVIRGGTNVVTYACGGADVLNKAGGPTTGTLTLVGQAVTLQYKASGAIWYITDDDLPYGSLLTIAAPAYAATVMQSITGVAQIEMTLTGNLTLTLSGGADGQPLRIRLKQDATGSRLLTLGAKFRLGADLPSIVLSTAANKTDYLGVVYNGTDDTYDVVSVNRGF